MAHPITSHHPHSVSHDEQILVVKRSHLFSPEPWYGIRPDIDNIYLSIIMEKCEFLPRSLMEHDPTYKQIIPYLVFKHADHYFLMERRAQASEQRLKSKLTLGIGGHIRQEDMTSTSIFDWARREFHEEVAYSGELKVSPLGLVNDDSDEVGQVHLGYALLLGGDRGEITVKSELQNGRLVSLEECKSLRERMESWSSIVLDVLK